MVLEYYNLREQPFGVTPDCRYLYSSATHREALASLLYGLEAGRGFVTLIAKPGMGKTTLLFQALNQLKDKARMVFLFQTICTPIDFLQAVLADLGLQQPKGTLIELQSMLNEVVTEQFRAGKPLVVIIDEAQNLAGPVLELLRMLSNFETAQAKLIQIILSGQPQLAGKLSSPELVQLRQRVSIFACLKPFSPEETALYIDHRLRMAGYSGAAPLFTDSALGLIAQCSEGIPRNINNLCFNALSLGCALKQRTMGCDIIREVVADLDLEILRERTPLAALTEAQSTQMVPASFPSIPIGWPTKLAVACAILFILGGAFFLGHRWLVPQTTVRANSVVPPRIPVGPLSIREKPTSPRTTPADIVRVKPGQSLYRICLERFGSCNPERLHEIQILNPWLSNLDHIEPGQTIRVQTARKL